VDGGAEQAEGAELGHDLAVESLVPIGLEHARHQLVLSVFARRVAHHTLVLAELVVEQKRVIPLEYRLAGGLGRSRGGGCALCWRHRGLLGVSLEWRRFLLLFSRARRPKARPGPGPGAEAAAAKGERHGE